MLFINLISNFLGWIAMWIKRWIDLIMINLLAVLVIVLILFQGCGTGIGNPENREDNGFPTATFANEKEPDEEEFQTVIDEYTNNDNLIQSGGVECGSYTEQSSLNQIDTGRQCIRDALQTCKAARYLLDQTLSSDQRFTSSVSVKIASASPLTCQLHVHTVSSDSSKFVGNREKSCSSLGAAESIELACNLLD